MKKLVSLLLCLVMVFCVTVPTFAAEKPIKVKLCNYMDSSGKWVKEKYIKFDSQPIIEDGRTLVPIRAIAEELGYDVNWLPQYNAATITYTLDKKGQTTERYKNKNQTLRLVNLLYNIEAKNSYVPKSFELYKHGFSYGESESSTIYSIGDIISDSSGLRTVTLYFWLNSDSSQIMVKHEGLKTNPLTFYNLDVPAKIVKERTLIPLRAFGEMLGLDVSWDGDTRTVIISA